MPVIEYDPTVWRPGVEGGTMVTADRLNKMESGIRNSYLQGANVAEMVATPGSLVQSALNEWYGGRAEGVTLSVLDFGADSFGKVDSTGPIQAAMDAIGNLGGGQLVFPPGTYIMDTIKLVDNVTIIGYGATLTAVSYYAFMGLSTRGKGYGAGPRNVTFRNLDFAGEFAKNKQLSITMHHADNVMVDSCTFTEVLIEGHIFDLLGCQNVTFLNNKFIGWKQTGNLFREAIQLDNSYAIGGNYDARATYDGLACKKIGFYDNDFLPITVGSIRYASPATIGNHASLPSAMDDINIIRNRFFGITDLDKTMGSAVGGAGVIKFASGCYRLNIKDNLFAGESGSHVRAIRLHATGTGLTAGMDFGDPNLVATAITPRPYHETTIENNTFSGFNGVAKDFDILGVEADTGGDGRHLTIKDNEAINCVTGSAPALGSRWIYVRRMNRVEIASNQASGVRLGIKMSIGVSIKVHDNQITGCTNLAIDCTDGVDRITVSENIIENSGSGIRIANTSNTFRIFGNICRDLRLTTVIDGGIIVFAATHGLITDNLLINSSALAMAAIFIAGGGSPVCYNIAANNNKAVGFTDTVKIGTGMSLITQVNNT